MTRRKANYLQGLSAAPYLLPAEDHRINRASVWAPDNVAPKGALGVRSGVVHGPGTPGKLTVVAGGVNINPFHAVVQGTTSTTQGAYEVTSDAVEFRAVTAYSATQFRAGYVIVHLYDQVSGAGAGDTRDDWDIEVIYGPPAATAGAATLPALPASSLVMGQFTVDNNGVITLSGGVPYTHPRGGILPVIPDGLALPGHDGYNPPAGASATYRDHPIYGLQRWDGTRWGGPLPLTAWVDDLNTTSYSYTLGTVTGNPTGMATRSLTLPPGRTLEVDLSVAQVSLGASTTAFIQLFAWAGASASQPGDAGVYSTSSAGGMAIPARLLTHYTNTGSTDQTAQWSVAANAPAGTCTLTAGTAGVVRLRHRVI